MKAIVWQALSPPQLYISPTTMVPIPSSQIRTIAESGFFDLEQLRGRCDTNAGGVDVFGLDWRMAVLWI